MAWSMVKEEALRCLVNQGVVSYADGLMRLSVLDDAEVESVLREARDTAAALPRTQVKSEEDTL